MMKHILTLFLLSNALQYKQHIFQVFSYKILFTDDIESLNNVFLCSKQKR